MTNLTYRATHYPLGSRRWLRVASDLEVEVEVNGVRGTKGALEVKVTPIRGFGSGWVDVDRLRIRPLSHQTGGP
jgi:hypothetical protein